MERYYRVKDRLRESAKNFFENRKDSIRVGREESDMFSKYVNLIPGCVMSPSVFNLFMGKLSGEKELKE